MTYLTPEEETLLIPLWARARDAASASPIIGDQTSRRIAHVLEANGVDLHRFDGASASLAGICIRGQVIDQWASQWIQENPEGIVIELGSGLNTRQLRLREQGIQPRLWIEADLPGALALRKTLGEFFQSDTHVKMVKVSLTNDDWTQAFTSTLTAHRELPVLILSEGLLMYFQESTVKRVFASAAKRFPKLDWMFDALAPLMVWGQCLHDSMGQVDAHFEWSLDEKQDPENIPWHDNYNVIKNKGFGELTSHQLQPCPWWLKLLLKTPPGKRVYLLNWVQRIESGQLPASP